MYELDEKHETREAFLRAFVSLLTTNAYNPKKEKILEEEEIKIFPPTKVVDVPVEEIPVTERMTPSPRPSLPQSVYTAPMLQRPQMQKPHFPFQQGIRPSFPMQKKQPAQKLTIGDLKPRQEKKPKATFQGIVREGVDLGKITSILRDPSVTSIECPGPSKSVLVNKSGRVEATPLMLTSDEIDKIMNEISDKTRIPLVPSGTFKAAIEDLLVTAIVSDVAGTRFIIQKRNPFQQF